MRPPFANTTLLLLAEHWPEHLAQATGSPAWLAQAERATAHTAMALRNFANSGPLVAQTNFLAHLLVLPLPGPVAVAAPAGEEEYIVIGQQFIDLLRFHAQASACLQVAEFLLRSGAPISDALAQARPLALWCALEWMHDWFKSGGAVPSLRPLVRSPLALGMESDVLMQGLLFLVLHECGHFALGHATVGPNDHGVATFEQMSSDVLSPMKRQELAADAWAVRAQRWINPAWQTMAVCRLFLMFGIAHAALSVHPKEHPYVHDRCAHLIAALQSEQVQVTPEMVHLPRFVAEEYALRERRLVRSNAPSAQEHLSVLQSFLAMTSQAFESAGSDAAHFGVSLTAPRSCP